MPPHSKEGLLPVTQEDREAAMQTVPDDGSHSSYMMVEAIDSGGADDWPLVQAFARHRLAHSLRGGEELREAAENLIIGIGMGWDLDGLVERVQAALSAAGSVVAQGCQCGCNDDPFICIEADGSDRLASPPPVDRAEAGELERLREALQRIQDEPDHMLPIVTAQRLRNIAGFALLGERLA